MGEGGPHTIHMFGLTHLTIKCIVEGIFKPVCPRILGKVTGIGKLILYFFCKKTRSFLHQTQQVGHITLFLLRFMILSRSRLPMRLCALLTHSPGICMLESIALSMAIMLGECMRDAWVIN